MKAIEACGPEHGGGAARAWRGGVGVLSAAMGLLAGGCSHAQHLAEYDFRGATISVSTYAPSSPDVLGGMDLSFDRSDPVGSLLRAGSEMAREASLQAFRSRLDSASSRVDVARVMGQRTVDGVARHLRAKPVPVGGEVDAELALRVRRYGIRAKSWSLGARFVLDADLVLLDGPTGRVVWRKRVRATEPVSGSDVRTDRRAVGNAVTAIALARMSTPEIQAALERLADFSADALIDAFVRDLDDARGG